MSKLEINGVELELDLLDADNLEFFQERMAKIVEDINEPTQYDGISNADAMRLQCKLVEDLFDDLFGDGTSQAIFVKHGHLGEHLEAFGKLSDLAGKANDEAKAISARHIRQVDPNANRATRRYAQFKKKPSVIPHG